MSKYTTWQKMKYRKHARRYQRKILEELGGDVSKAKKKCKQGEHYKKWILDEK